MFDENGNRKYCHKTGKVCYTEHDAGVQLNKRKKGNKKLKTRRLLNKNKDTVKKKYKCPYCGWWHLSHYGSNRKKGKFYK